MFFVETFKLSFRYYKQMNIDPVRKPYSSAGARSTRYQIQQYWCVVCTHAQQLQYSCVLVCTAVVVAGGCVAAVHWAVHVVRLAGSSCAVC